ncbi:hypothetical protein DFH06DRAFT_1320170 [Mycena polygramma]|nr:hypothetical protein DFH06DRAFT_1320170 [Mycena polygramma]
MATDRVSLTVYFKPLVYPVDSAHRMPVAGSEYGPFHPAHGPLPPDATERKDVDCSSSIVHLWSEFQSRILPLLQLPPPPVDGASRRAVYVDLLHRDRNEHQVVKQFMRRVAPTASALYVSLFRPTPAPKSENEVYNAILGLELPKLDDPHIEFGIIAAVFIQLGDYFGNTGRYEQFAVEVINPCSPWEHVYASGTHLTLRIAQSLKKKSPTEHAQVIVPLARYPSSGSSSAGKSPDSSPELGIDRLKNTIGRYPDPSSLRRRRVGRLVAERG